MMAADYTSAGPFVIGFIGAAVPVTLGAWFVRRKTKAETADIITDAAGRLVEQLERRIADLERRLLAAEAREATALVRIGELTVEIGQLRAQVADAARPPTTTTTVTSSVTKQTPTP
jgi:chromosome segregation ATPase